MQGIASFRGFHANLLANSFNRKANPMADKNDFMAQAKAQMDAWTAEMTKMQGQIQAAGTKGQEQMAKQMESLNEQRAHAQKHMEDLGKANMDAAKEIQATMQTAWKDMEKSMEDARKKFMG